MQTEIIIAGFGGQGVLFAGQLLAYTAMEEGLDVTWYPSYGPEMRGGTANCTVIIADEEIGAPVVTRPTACIAMNLPSLDKYENLVKKDGILIIDSSMVDRPVKREDVRTVVLPASSLAEELGNKRMSNMILLGALIANLPVISMESFERSLKEHLPERHMHLLEANVKALELGASYVAE
jgi:2-oxoglutarate ferredoxin oxidoreductase subunit gamma